MISRGTLLCRSNSADVNVGLGNRGGEDVLSRHGVRKGNAEQMAVDLKKEDEKGCGQYLFLGGERGSAIQGWKDC